MLTEKQIEKTNEVINHIMGECAFVFVDPLSDDDKPDIGSWEPRGVSLSFEGFKSGKISLWADDEFLVSTAANMLGIDEDNKEAAQKGMDSLKEVLNMILGNLLTTLFGTEPVFELGLPKVASKEQLLSELDTRACIWLESEMNPVLFTLDVEVD